MHIPDNYLSPQTCAVLAAAAIPVIGLALKKVKYQVTEKKRNGTHVRDFRFTIVSDDDV